MPTLYYELNEPWTRVHVRETVGNNVLLELWEERWAGKEAKSGTIAVSEEHAGMVLRQLANEKKAVAETWIGRDAAHLRTIAESRTDCVVSKEGQLASYRELCTSYPRTRPPLQPAAEQIPAAKETS